MGKKSLCIDLPDIFLRTCAAGFGALVSRRDEKGTKCAGKLIWADPKTAITPLVNSEDTHGNIVLVERCKDIDFIDKCVNVQNAGGVAMVVVNYEDGPTLHSMAGKRKEINIPAIMVTQKHGAEINKILAAEGSTLHANIFLSKHFHYNGQKDIGGCFAAKRYI